MVNYRNNLKDFLIPKKRYANFIDGQWSSPTLGLYSKRYLNDHNNNEPYKVAISCKKDMSKALSAAYIGQKRWNKTSIQQRLNILLLISKKIEKNISLLAWTEARTSKRSAKDIFDVDLLNCINHIRRQVNAIKNRENSCLKLNISTLISSPSQSLNIRNQYIHENTSLTTIILHIVTALIAGDSIVLRVSHLRPIAALTLIQIIGRHLPNGSVNIIIGFYEYKDKI